MWRDRERYPEQNYVPDTFWLVVAMVLFAACGLVWLIGQVAAICFGPHHEHLPVRLVDMLGVLLQLPGTWDDPSPRLAILRPAAAARPARHVRRRGSHLLDSGVPVWTAGPAALPQSPPPTP